MAKTKKITMMVFCAVDDVGEVTESMVGWWEDHDVPMTRLKIEEFDPTEEEDQKASKDLDLEDAS